MDGQDDDATMLGGWIQEAVGKVPILGDEETVFSLGQLDHLAIGHP